MKRAVVLIPGIAALLMTGCSTVNTTFDYDSQADFSRFETFAWMPRDAGTGGGVQLARMDNSLFVNRLKKAVNNHLEGRGYSIDTVDPDLVIIYHIGMQDKVNVTNWGYTYGPHWGPWGESVDVYQYTEGTLILDFIDFGTKKIIWRGTARKALSGGTDPEKADAEIQKVVDKLLVKFPPL